MDTMLDILTPKQEDIEDDGFFNIRITPTKAGYVASVEEESGFSVPPINVLSNTKLGALRAFCKELSYILET